MLLFGLPLFIGSGHKNRGALVFVPPETCLDTARDIARLMRGRLFVMLTSEHAIWTFSRRPKTHTDRILEALERGEPLPRRKRRRRATKRRTA